MPTPAVFADRKEELERAEFELGAEAGRLAVTLDLLTDAMVLVMQHGVYCHSARQPGQPALDIQVIARGIEQAKELVQSVMGQIRGRKP
ncbi:MAG: hypothetical protein ABSC08_06875 [Bryobacteraceae bacterium]|jgi:hypothetical protein